MKPVLIPAAIILALTPAIAAEPKGVDLASAIEEVTATYRGSVVSAQTDPIGGDTMHYHVDLLLPDGSLAKFEFDPKTQRVSKRMDAQMEAAPGAGLADAMKKVQAQTKGTVVSAEFHAKPKPHYHMNIAMTGNGFARVNYDIESGKIERRKPHS